MSRRRTARPARSDPLIIVTNDSAGLVSDEELARIVPAIQRQATEHFQPVWGTGVRLILGKGRAPQEAYKINIIDRAKSGEDAGFLGYHFQENGYPVASIFAAEDLSADKTISETLSHEVMEMLVAPALNLYAYRPGEGRRRRDRGYFYEVCNAVQSRHYPIDGVKVCDFVYPEWFEYAWPRGSRRFDHLGLLRKPFEILPGCYADIREAGRGWRTLWGDDTGKKKRRHRRDARLTQNSF